MGALAHAHRQGKALYVGISSYSPELTRKAYEILKRDGVPLLIHQPSYSILNRWIERGLLDTLAELGVECIAFSPLAQGMLTSKYLNGVPQDARAVRGRYFTKDALTEANLEHIRTLNEVARERGQTLAQMAIAWVLRDPRVTSALIGARSVEQLEDSLAAVRNLSFGNEELERIDDSADVAGIDIWSDSSAITESE
jgi:L-glyceraldehyde 3-phosphate reductase